MNSIDRYQSKWHMPFSLTGASAVLCIAMTLPSSVALASRAGTGGSNNDASLFKDRLSNGNSHWKPIALPHAENYARDATECLARIREVFAPSVSDLAATLGVSRQTVYNWQNGEQPKEALAVKLTDLARAADIFAQSNIQFNSALASRKFANGKTLFQVVQSNGSATEAAKLLMRILETEAGQRKVLEARFANRPITALSGDFDLPLANDPA